MEETSLQQVSVDGSTESKVEETKLNKTKLNKRRRRSRTITTGKTIVSTSNNPQSRGE